MDNNGDGQIDEGPVLAAIDSDGDGFGDPSTAVLVLDCGELLAGEVSDATDVDDLDDTRHPNAEEACNSLDDNGDGIVDEDACNSDAYVRGDDIYKVSIVEMTWTDAQTACTSTGHHLATLSNATQQDELTDILAPYGIDFWIGLSDQLVEGDFVWGAGSGGSPVGYSNWRKGEPNDSGYDGEDCVEMEAVTGLWDDQPCTALEAFVCETDCDFLPFYSDEDGDGLGDPDTLTEACVRPAGYVANPLDCDDSDADLPRVGFVDVDGDGFGTGAAQVGCRLAITDGDCDDEDEDVNPGSIDLPDDGIDSDCDGVDPVDEEVDTGPLDSGGPDPDTGTDVVTDDPTDSTTDDGGTTDVPGTNSSKATTSPDEDRDYGFGLGCSATATRPSLWRWWARR